MKFQYLLGVMIFSFICSCAQASEESLDPQVSRQNLEAMVASKYKDYQNNQDPENIFFNALQDNIEKVYSEAADSISQGNSSENIKEVPQEILNELHDL